MSRRLKLLAGLSTLAASGALALSGCGGGGSEGEGAEGEGEGAQSAVATPAGEGEGGEGANAVAADKAEFIAQLMILRGHLKAGVVLYEAGDAGAAKAHMKHPHDEVYARLSPMFAAFGAQSVDAELEALAAAVESGAAANDVAEKFARISAAVARAIETSAPALQDRLLAASRTLRQAAVEFDEGVKDGVIVDAKEYQDAYGFTATVVEALAGVEGAGPAEKDAVAVARDQAALALAVTPTALSPQSVDGAAATIFGAAARIEIAALGLGK